MFKAKDLAVGIAAIAFGIFILLQAQTIVVRTSLDPAGPAALPSIMAWAMIVLGLIHIVGGVLARAKQGTKAEKKSVGARLAAFFEHYREVLIVMLIGAAFCVLFDILGYLISIPLLFASILWVLGKRDIKSLLGVNLALTAVLFVLFRFGLSVDLPLGPIGLLFQ